MKCHSCALKVAVRSYPAAPPYAVFTNRRRAAAALASLLTEPSLIKLLSLRFARRVASSNWARVTYDQLLSAVTGLHPTIVGV